MEHASVKVVVWNRKNKLLNEQTLFKKYPPKCVYVSSSRILCAKNALFDEMRAGGGSAVAYAWYEFEKGYTGESKLKWIN